jgi:hypothetical protein
MAKLNGGHITPAAKNRLLLHCHFLSGVFMAVRLMPNDRLRHNTATEKPRTNLAPHFECANYGRRETHLLTEPDH